MEDATPCPLSLALVTVSISHLAKKQFSHGTPEIHDDMRRRRDILCKVPWSQIIMVRLVNISGVFGLIGRERGLNSIKLNFAHQKIEQTFRACFRTIACPVSGRDKHHWLI